MGRKHSFSFIVLSSLCMAYSQAQQPRFTSTDVKLLSGQWRGTLTYLDYSTKKPYTMPADVQVSHLPKDNLLLFAHTYPNEPKANGTDTVVISADGRMLDKEVLQSKSVLSDGNLEIVTEKEGVDGNDNKPARLRYTYTLGQHVFIKRKDVKFEGQTGWINRHTFSYTR